MDSRTRRSQTSESGRTPLAGNAHSGTNTQPPAGSATSSSHPTRSSNNSGPVESGSSSTTTPRPRPRLQHIGVLPPGPNRRPNSTGANVYLLSSDYDSDSDTPVSGTPRGNVNTQGSDQNQAGRSFHALPETSVLRDWDTLESTSRLTEQDILEITRISAVHALAPSLRPFFINRRLRPTGSSNDTGMEDDGITTRGRRVLARSTASRPVFDTRRTVSTQVPDPMHYRPRYSSNLFAIPSNHSFGFADHDMSNSSSPRDNFLLSQPDTGRGSNGQHGASEVPTANQTSNRPSVGAVTTPSIPLRTSATAIRGLRRPSNPSTTGAPNPTRFTDVNTRPRDVGNRLSQMQEQLNRLRAEGDLLLSQSSDSSDTSTDHDSPRVISFTRSSGPSTRATNANTGTRSPSGSQTRASGQRLRTSVAAPTNNSVSGSGDGINHQVRQLLDDDGWSVVVESVMTRTLPSASESAEYHSPTQTQSPAQTTLAQRRGVLTGHSHSSRSGHPTHSLPHSDSARDDLDKVTTVIDGRGVNPSTFTYSSEPFRPNPLPMKLSDMMVSTKYPRIVR
ncbi:hypothetical protein FRC03_000124 [Tulasnella sp. 419]|nr:hypothetical protein FRC03_000124 [Tulasnella sp. 419]